MNFEHQDSRIRVSLQALEDHNFQALVDIHRGEYDRVLRPPETIKEFIERFTHAYATRNIRELQNLRTAYSAIGYSISSISSVVCTLPVREDVIQADQQVHMANCGYTIALLDTGRLYITPIIPVVEYIAPPVNTVWNAEIEETVAKVYAEFLTQVRYNSFSICDNFIDFVLQVQQERSDLSLEDLYALYFYKTERIAEKYKGNGEYGGNCFDHSYIFIKKLEAMGIHAYLLGYNIPNIQGSIPNKDGQMVPWDQAMCALGYTHGCVGVLVREDGDIYLLKYEMGIGTEATPVKYKWDTETKAFCYYVDGKLRTNHNALFANAEAGCNPLLTVSAADIARFNKAGILSHYHLTAISNADVTNAAPTENLAFDFFKNELRLVSKNRANLEMFMSESGASSSISTDITEDGMTSSYTLTSAGAISKVRERAKDGRFELKIPLAAFSDDLSARMTVSASNGDVLNITAEQALQRLLIDIATVYKMPDSFARNMHYVIVHRKEYCRLFYKRP